MRKSYFFCLMEQRAAIGSLVQVIKWHQFLITHSTSDILHILFQLALLVLARNRTHLSWRFIAPVGRKTGACTLSRRLRGARKVTEGRVLLAWRHRPAVRTVLYCSSTLVSGSVLLAAWFNNRRLVRTSKTPYVAIDERGLVRSIHLFLFFCVH